MVDSRGYRAVLAAANKSSTAAAAGKWVDATRRWEAVEGEILAATKHADFYNVLAPVEAKQEDPRDAPKGAKGHDRQQARPSRPQSANMVAVTSHACNSAFV